MTINKLRQGIMGYGIEKGSENHLTGTILAVGITASLLAGVGAGVGAFVGLALSFASLSPLIAGGIIGSVLPAVLFTATLLFSEYILNKCIDSCDKEPLLEEYQKGLKEDYQSMKEYIKSTEHKVKFYTIGIVYVGVSFGIGAGLVALGFTSPAAIGALAVLASSVTFIPLCWLIDKAVDKCFSFKENEQPGGFLGGVYAAEGGRETYLG